MDGLTPVDLAEFERQHAGVIREGRDTDWYVVNKPFKGERDDKQITFFPGKEIPCKWAREKFGAEMLNYLLVNRYLVPRKKKP